MVIKMQSIEEKIELTEMVKKSKFITKLYPVQTEEEALRILEIEKAEHRDATHVCYGYKIGPSIKVSDDGEPGGTAGLPILNMIEKKQLDFILCIVIRYFGGIKLGAGGLIRAYGGAVKRALEKSSLITLNHGKEIQITFLYEKTKTVDYLLREVPILHKSFDENITYVFHIQDTLLKEIEKELKKITIDIQIRKNILVKEQ